MTLLKYAFLLSIAASLSACSKESALPVGESAGSAAPLSIVDPDMTGTGAPALVTRPGPASPSVRATPYLAGTYGQVAAKSSVAGAGLDGKMALSYADDVCNLKLDVRYTGEESLSDLRLFKERFCADHAGSPDSESRFGAVDGAADAGDVEAGLLQLADGVPEDAPKDQLDLVRSDLISASRTTTSPYFFQTALETAFAEPFYDAASDDNRPAGMDDQSLAKARSYGSLLASCERFKHCGPNSLMAKRVCMPSRCAAGQDVRAFVRRELPSDVYQEAERSARMLLAEVPALQEH